MQMDAVKSLPPLSFLKASSSSPPSSSSPSALAFTSSTTSNGVVVMPRSMTIFNIKDIQDKLDALQKSSKTPPASSSPTTAAMSSTFTSTPTSAQTTPTSASPAPLISIQLKLEDDDDYGLSRYLAAEEEEASRRRRGSVGPFVYSKCDNLYICSLCQSTYYSLRSIKAHIWKHSGHRGLTYPIMSSCEPSSSSSSTSSTSSTVEQQVNNNNNNATLMAPLATQTSPVLSPTLSPAAEKSTGICSVLLEVIEQAIDAESSSSSSSSSSSYSSSSSSSSSSSTGRKHKSGNDSRPPPHKRHKTTPTLTTTSNTFCSYSNENSVADHLSPLEETLPSIPSITTTPTTATSTVTLPLSASQLAQALGLEDNGDEEYVCSLCSYVCYHLPSLKSHMWTHVKHERFDYTVNTRIINAALDYENKLSKLIQQQQQQQQQQQNGIIMSQDHKSERAAQPVVRLDGGGDVDNLDELAQSVERELSDYSAIRRRLASHLHACTMPALVAFRCARCAFQTIDLCSLRVHKRREHHHQQQRQPN